MSLAPALIYMKTSNVCPRSTAGQDAKPTDAESMILDDQFL